MSPLSPAIVQKVISIRVHEFPVAPRKESIGHLSCFSKPKAKPKKMYGVYGFWVSLSIITVVGIHLRCGYQ